MRCWWDRVESVFDSDLELYANRVNPDGKSRRSISLCLHTDLRESDSNDIRGKCVFICGVESLIQKL